MPIDQEIADLAQAIARSRRAVVFTGAGISTESGIPDFRSPGGIWTRMAPIDFSDFLASEEARRETWRRRFAMEDTFREARPNRGHRAVAELVRRGNTTYAHCLDCKSRYELAALRAAFERDETVPICGDCGGYVKTATISFG